MGRDRRSTRRLAALVVVALSCAFAPLAGAQAQDAKDRARRHYETAEAFRKAGANDKAIEEYQAAYQLAPRPGFLFNIALAYQDLGDAARAVEYYGKFLDSRPQGDIANEALARKTQLEREIAAAADKARVQREAQATAERTQKEATAHQQRAIESARAGRHDDAAREYKAAYDISRDAELLFDLAEVERARGDRKQALVTFERYRAAAPGGPRAGDAIEHIAVLEREIAGTGHGSDAVVGQPLAVSQPAAPEKPKKRVLWLVAAAAAVGAGVAIDLLPNSASNGELDATDLVPVGLYGLASVFTFRGVF